MNSRRRFGQAKTFRSLVVEGTQDLPSSFNYDPHSPPSGKLQICNAHPESAEFSHASLFAKAQRNDREPGLAKALIEMISVQNCVPRRNKQTS